MRSGQNIHYQNLCIVVFISTERFVTIGPPNSYSTSQLNSLQIRSLIHNFNRGISLEVSKYFLAPVDSIKKLCDHNKLSITAFMVLKQEFMQTSHVILPFRKKFHFILKFLVHFAPRKPLRSWVKYIALLNVSILTTPQKLDKYVRLYRQKTSSLSSSAHQTQFPHPAYEVQINLFVHICMYSRIC